MPPALNPLLVRPLLSSTVSAHWSGADAPPSIARAVVADEPAAGYAPPSLTRAVVADEPADGGARS